MGRIQRSIVEIGKGCKVRVKNSFASEKALPGAGFTVVKVAEKTKSGEQRLLELRFKSDFLPHAHALLRALEDLLASEKDRTMEMLETARDIANRSTKGLGGG